MTQTSGYNDIELNTWRLGLISSFILVFLAGLYQVHLISFPLDHVYSDMRGYIERAWRLVAGDPLSAFDSFFPAGMNYLYGLVFLVLGFDCGIQFIIYLQIFFIASSAVLVGLITNLIFESRRASLFACLLATLYWPFIGQLSFFVSEPPFIFFLLLSQYLVVWGVKKNIPLPYFLLIGAVYAFTCLIKGQGLCIFIPALLFLLLKNRLAMVLFAFGFISLIVPQLYLNHILSEGRHAGLAGNGAYNTYLGQSRHRAVLALNPNEFNYHIFHQNNSFFDENLLEPKIVSAEIIDSKRFKAETLELWRNNPKLQLIRSFQSIGELFSLVPAWPMRDLQEYRPYQVGFRLAFLILIFGPAALMLVSLLRNKHKRSEGLLCMLPLALLCGMVFLSMGQPRYLLPFKYNLIILAAVFYFQIYLWFYRQVNKEL